MLSTIRRSAGAIAFVLLAACGTALMAQETAKKKYPLGGADEKTPSISHYFSWINNTNEGATEAHTLANLDFFKMLNDKYGMELDIYAWDAGNIDAPRYYGSIFSDRFKSYYPNGMKPIFDKASSFNCRMGVWLGPDGFGDDEATEKARREMLVKLCKDYDFYLFKVDAVCGQLRTEKQPAFVKMVKECRKYCPDLIILNHRLNLGEGAVHTTTTLWGGEAYIDVWRRNDFAATHNRACVIKLGVPIDKEGNLQRLVEDHGVCISSCLDYWDDDLVLQAFSRNLILAPEVYGSPWFLRDDELPKLARIYNLCRTYRDILVNGILLPEETYGKFAVSRGDDNTRIVTLRNPDWNTVKYDITLGEEIGLKTDKPIEVRMLHPYEEVLGTFKAGDTIPVEVIPFRAAMIIATTKPSKELGVEGTPYEVICDKPGRPAVVKLLGMPGTSATVKLADMPRTFKSAKLDGKPVDELLKKDGSIKVDFPGTKLTKPWHRKLADLTKGDVLTDAEALYEATVFAADNNALEIRSKFRSGETNIPEVKKAREEFFNQELLVERGVWDKYLFDGDLDTFFRLRTRSTHGGALRIDLGKETKIDKIVLRRVEDNLSSPFVEVSSDLKNWTKVPAIYKADAMPEARVLQRSYTVEKTWLDIKCNTITAKVPADANPIRYIRIPGEAKNVAEVEGYLKGKKLDRTGWRGSNVFAAYPNAPVKVAWSGSFTLDESAKGSCLVVPVIGNHGREGAYAALKIGDRYIGAPERAGSYPVNHWEHGTGRPSNGMSYLFPITDDMIGKKITAVTMQFEAEEKRGRPATLGELESQVWITSYPIPFESKELVLED